MSRFFKPYEGNRPYLFISYAHKQSEEVVSTIRILYEKGWRLWYDEGIPAGRATGLPTSPGICRAARE